MLKIETFVVVNNSERFIPYLIRHYGKFSKVILLENNSTDNTVKEGIKHGAEIRKYMMPDVMDNLLLAEIRNNCWKKSKADWVIVVDEDEFVYHPDIVDILKESKATVIHPTFHNMFSEKFPTTKRQIYDEVKMGTPDGDIWWSKMNILRPDQIDTMNWGVGSHTALPEGNVIIDNNSGIKTLHMSFLSRQFIIEKYKRKRSRYTETDIKNGWGGHSFWTEEKINKYFDENKPKLIKLV